ncbi:MAG: ABC transporter permease [Acetatifactor sp.]|nr:ABC transporter permease [Acetatifactor sp.]
MWKDYSLSYIKSNRSSSISVIVASFISALLLSLLCSFFYNLWKSDVDRIRLQEGDWQGRITGELDEVDLSTIQNYSNVEKFVVNTELSGEQELVVDLYFTNMRTILTDLPRIANLVGLESEAVSYHHSLLSMYLIRDPQDTAPRLLFPAYLSMTVMACVSLVLIIHNAFAMSMSTRVHQFGIFSSIGATPRQIRTCLLQEAGMLTALPILLGNLLGIVISKGVIAWANTIAVDAPGHIKTVWGYHPLVFAVTLLASCLTIFFSALLPARKLSKLTPLEAIRSTDELRLKRRKHSHILAFFFGIEGELSGNALKAQKKAFRTATLSLTLSFLAFTLMQCFFTLSQISTTMTYFERYQDAWDVMVTVKSTKIDEFEETDALSGLSGVQNVTVYQKAAAKKMITKEEISEELRALGGFANAPEAHVSSRDDGWLVNALLVIMDDASFLQYCEQVGIAPSLDGAVILNYIRDITNSNFRDPGRLPYVKEDSAATVLRQAGQEEITAEVPVLAYTREVPVLREAYGELDHYVLVHFLPVSVWREIEGQIGGTESDSYIRVLAEDGATLEELNELETMILGLISSKYETESENRIQEKLDNDEMIQGMMTILGGFCVLLAIIGLGNVFSNTLGFVQQRRREFARYLSVGLTPSGIRKMFCLEALVIAGRPVLITLPVTAVALGLMIRASYLEPTVFLREAPILPVAIFLLAIFGFVALAYYLGGRKLFRCDLSEVLRDDTL